MHLREREARAEVPTSAELPLTELTRRVGQDEVDVVATVDMGLILH
ncbi:MAG: hypothetical protein J6P73_03880 [Bacteroidales bacterium]|nr:hypothetical protein [Bacteroidales bacterium]